MLPVTLSPGPRAPAPDSTLAPYHQGACNHGRVRGRGGRGSRGRGRSGVGPTKVGITQPLAKALETRVGVTQSLCTHPTGVGRAQSSEGESTGAASAVATVAKTFAGRYPPDPVLQSRAREAWHTMVIQYHAQKQHVRGAGCARTLSQKQLWQVHGPSAQEAMIIKAACNTQPSVLGEEVPKDIRSVSSAQGGGQPRLGPASAPISSATGSQHGALAVKAQKGLAGMGKECATEGLQQIMSGMGAVEVVAEVAEAILVGLSDLFSDELEAEDG